ncbi:uncharacterized protein PAC_08431 [Phialocephala subalpina]|uniref:Uncharacterized protein n=1 Tax=Phialocephala subalpina TaxID=576137 RepID=A0A1L7X0L1_9HELO|nr:uncharacterized protein PAC_08431 [Phialocephala subalpina]
MSFGWSVGDIYSAGRLLLKIGEALSEAHGAPQHFRETTNLFPPINFQMRRLGVLIKQYHDEWKSDNGECSLLEESDINDFRPVISQLKLLVGQLCETLAKGTDMGLATNPSLRKWPKAQLKKLQWQFLEIEGVESLIRKIHQQTQHVSAFYQVISTELSRRNHQKLDLLLDSALKQQLRLLDSSMPSKLLSVGPEDGISKEKLTEASGLFVNSALAHLEDFTYEVMENKASLRMPNLKADHVLRTAITSWLAGLTPPRLCLQGSSSTNVTGIFYHVALEKRRPIVAFACRFAEKGKLLSHEERLLQMVYSVLFQLLQQHPEGSSFDIPDVGGFFSDLNLSMESMPLALRYMKYFLDLVPQNIVILDKFQYLGTDGKSTLVDTYLRDFLNLFGNPGGEYQYQDDGCRLLVSTYGKERIVHGMAKDEKMAICKVDDHVDRGSNKLMTTLRGEEW